MTAELVLRAPEPEAAGALGLAELRRMVLLAVKSEHTQRNYGKALDELFALSAERRQPLSRDLLMEYRAAMLARKLSASTINVRLSAVRKLIDEARRNGILPADQAAAMADVPNIPQQGTRLGNWLTREQARELLTVPDRSTLKGKRDAAILALFGWLRSAPGRAGRAQDGGYSAARGPLGDRRSLRQRRPHSHCGHPYVGQAPDGHLDNCRRA